MKRLGRRLRKPASRKGRERARLVRTLAACGGNPADMLELYYWAREPGFTKLIRAIATMPERTRAALETFIMLARDAKSVSANLDPRGVLTFCSAEAEKSVALAQRLPTVGDEARSGHGSSLRSCSGDRRPHEPARGPMRATCARF